MDHPLINKDEIEMSTRGVQAAKLKNRPNSSSGECQICCFLCALLPMAGAVSLLIAYFAANIGYETGNVVSKYSSSSCDFTCNGYDNVNFADDDCGYTNVLQKKAVLVLLPCI